MVEALHLELLGGLRIRQGDTPITRFVSGKAPALLCYLAATGRPHFRASLAGLLWSELADTDARMNLRHVLANLRHLLGDHLLITRDTIAFNREQPYTFDLERFEAALHVADAPSAAVALYQGDFLDGFYVRAAPLFEEWVAAQRERLR